MTLLPPDPQNGWAIPTADGVSDPDRRDELEASALYDLLDKSVKSRFYDRTADGVPQRWVQMVRHTLRTLGPQVLASRMVRDYVHQLYAPAAQASRTQSAKKHAPAKELAAWRRRVVEAWPRVTVGSVESSGDTDMPTLGSELHLRAVIDLGGLTADDVVVQAVYGRVDEADLLHETGVIELSADGVSESNGIRYEGAVPLARAGSFGFTVRVLPQHPLLATPAALGLVVTA